MMSNPDPGERNLSFLRIDTSRKGPHGPGGTPPVRHSRKKLMWMGLAVGLIVAAVFIVHALASVPEVRVERARLESGSGAAPGTVVLTAGGYIVAHHTIEVSSKVIGKVAWVGVEQGQKVKKGQVLVRLDASEFRAQLEEAKANLHALNAKLAELEAGTRPQQIAASFAAVQQARANNVEAQLNLRRTSALYRQGILSRSQMDNATAQAGVDKARLASARENYQIAKIGPRVEDINYARAQVAAAKASVAYARSQLAGTVIRAPISGTVLERNVEVGELVSTMSFGGGGGVKTSVVTLANLNDLQVELDINESDFSLVAMGQKCRVTADAYPNRIYQGVVEEISPEANRQKGTIQVKVKILHPDSHLRPKMSAHASFLAPERAGTASKDVLTIPRRAVVSDNGGPAVFVLKGSRVRLQPIKTGHRLPSDRIEVLRGLSRSERIVVGPPKGLASDDRVRIKGA